MFLEVKSSYIGPSSYGGNVAAEAAYVADLFLQLNSIIRILSAGVCRLLPPNAFILAPWL